MPTSPLETQIRGLYNDTERGIKGKLSSDDITKKEIGDGFSINVMQFPEYLGTKEMNQYVLFNINVRGKSKLSLGSEKKIAVVNRVGSAQPNKDQLAAAKLVDSGEKGATVAIAGKAAISKLIADMGGAKQATTGINRTGANNVTTGLVGVGVGIALGSSGLLAADTTYRISDSIALYINDPPQVKYNAQYENKDLGSLAGFVGGMSAVDSLGSAGSMAAEGAQALGMSLAKIPSAAGIPTMNTSDIIGASAKVGMNPFKEVLFQSIDFRSFSFKYRFMPKSEQEANNIQAIIRTFKFHMHPELSASKLFFIYPSEFEISYIFQGKENEFFHKFKPCVLESMDVTYGGEQYSSFTDGRPTEVNLSLTFKETEILTKSQVKVGY
jgi:hypothetical protein